MFSLHYEKNVDDVWGYGLNFLSLLNINWNTIKYIFNFKYDKL